MSKKVRAEVIDGVVDGNSVGAIVDIDGRSAAQLEKRGFVRIIKEVADTPVKKDTSPKKPESDAPKQTSKGVPKGKAKVTEKKAPKDAKK